MALQIRLSSFYHHSVGQRRAGRAEEILVLVGVIYWTR